MAARHVQARAVSGIASRYTVTPRQDGHYRCNVAQKTALMLMM
ncbi:hypothetical protein [Pantoea ananatis]|nr:hypothetical protein [Pantoea ananatis]ERM13886.1 hypothetical protein L585_11610 [Pantoea ananatis BRT175]MCV3298448.1 hypothetical protein [Pantoea ananatis]MDQ1224023.1 hypothetical protein [Pantoea ananatis]MDR6091937.1 hypothetical protein [Pantoea ananatis]